VTAAAVILPPEYSNGLLNDSKKLSAKQRSMLRKEIELEAVCFGIAHVDPETIDTINILNASIYGMHQALEQLRMEPRHILVDGNQFKPFGSISHECIIKGDGVFMSIAAASILAKTMRDSYMETIHNEYPMYNWKQNKGYPTLEHRRAIKKYGLTKYHRKTFKIKSE
jgi:ribonuclease HII